MMVEEMVVPTDTSKVGRKVDWMAVMMAGQTEASLAAHSVVR